MLIDDRDSLNEEHREVGRAGMRNLLLCGLVRQQSGLGGALTVRTFGGDAQRNLVYWEVRE